MTPRWRNATAMAPCSDSKTRDHGDDFFRSMAVDDERNVVATSVGPSAFTVTKFNRDGLPLWQQTLNGGTAQSVAADNQGSVVAAGATSNPGASSDFTVVKFAR
jgi:hypothetical protein